LSLGSGARVFAGDHEQRKSRNGTPPCNPKFGHVLPGLP
jgi:hypothetical protein